MGKALVQAMTWVLARLGFWWFSWVDSGNTWQEGRELLFWGGSPHTDEPSKGRISVEWYFGKRARHCHAYVEFGEGGDYPFKVSLAIPRIVAVWISTDMLKRFWDGKERRWWNSREIGFHYHHYTLRFSFLSNRMGHDWYFKHKQWKREYAIQFEDLIFGRFRCRQEDVSKPTPIKIPMPEGNYDAVIWHGRRVWTWARFRKPKVREYTEIELTAPPKFSGKGENDWDQDDDGIFATSFNGFLTADEAAHEYRELVLKERRKYGEPSSYQVA